MEVGMPRINLSHPYFHFTLNAIKINNNCSIQTDNNGFTVSFEIQQKMTEALPIYIQDEAPEVAGEGIIMNTR
jgi:hypothetical protein